MVIADFVDAYWVIPLHATERRSQVAQWKCKWVVFLRTGQGTRESSLTWGMISAMVGRLGQSLYDESELLLQIYTDDPWSVVAGTLQERDDAIACILCLWMVFGLGVAFHKAVRGRDVVWIGIRYTLLTLRR